MINDLNDIELHNITHPDKEVLFVGATNLPEQIDDAIK